MKNYQKLLCFFGIAVSLLSVMSCSSTYEESTVRFSDGTTNNSIVAVKDYDIVGPIRVTAEREFNGSEWSGNKITYDMLLQKAYAMDADDIINVKIDTIVKTTESTENSNKIVKKTYSYIANGLAIKYTDALLVNPTPFLTSPLDNFDSSQIESDPAKKSSFNWKLTGIAGLATIGSLLLIGSTAQ
jgi:hypothetical protein